LRRRGNAPRQRTPSEFIVTPLICVLGVVALGADLSGQIAYVSGTEQEDQCVCVLDLASGEVARVGPGSRDGPPVWSPDGQWLAFETQRGGGMGVCLARADGSAKVHVPHRFEWNRYPRWSPAESEGASGGGLRVAYAANDWREFVPRIMVYDLESGEESQWGGEAKSLTRPVWMPNMKLLEALQAGQRLLWGGAEEDLQGQEWLEGESALVAVFLKTEPAGYTTDVFVLTRDHAAALPEFALPSKGRYAEWAVEPAPDGERVAFESNDGGDREIFVLTKKGAADVSNHRAADWNPVWSPDSEWLAFESFRDGRRGLYRVFPDTARVVPVAVTPEADNWWPTWSPDGRAIAFVSNRTGDTELFVADLTEKGEGGAKTRRITEHPGLDYAPAWRPEVRE